jgi:hypothetical protein
VRARTLAALASLALLAACKLPAPKTEAERTVTDTARGVRYVVPPGWDTWDAEIRSPAGSLMTLRVYDLAEADKQFVAGLPDTLMPQLTEWAKYYYVVDGPPTRVETTVASTPATELNYPIHIRPEDPPSKVTYWVLRHGTRLFVIRAAYPPRGLAADEPAIRKVVADWAFVEPAASGS